MWYNGYNDYVIAKKGPNMTPQELIKIRETLNLTKSQFAMLLGVTPMLYGRYESGSIIIPPHVKENVPPPQ